MKGYKRYEEEEEGSEEWKSDAEELREVLLALRREVPGLLKDLMEPIKEFMEVTYNPEKAKGRAKAIAGFYKELVDQGIPPDIALELTREHFINPISLIKAMTREEED